MGTCLVTQATTPFTPNLPLLVIEELGFAKESTLIQADSIQVSQVFSQWIQMLPEVAFHN